MGMNNYGAKRVIVDIETVSLAEAGEYLDPIEPLAPPDLSLITPAKNLVDPAKVAADIEKRRSAAIEEHRLRCEQQVQKRAEALERCALDLDLCRIVAIGWMFEDDREPHVLPAHSDEMEGDLLRAFWAALDDRVTVGYNQVGFDLPILLRRSLYLGVSAPMLNLDRYRSNHIDLQMRLSLNGTKPFRKLDWYCKRFGLDVPKDEHGGKDIGALVAADDWDGVTAHCRADVLKTAALARRMGILRPQQELVAEC